MIFQPRTNALQGHRPSAPVWRRPGPAILALAMWVSLAIGVADASSRIKDIAAFEGVRSNMLIGYGLVVGLNGTGDTLNNSPFTKESLIGMLERLGVNVRQSSINTDNVAAVMVTATLPPFARHGTRIDVTVSSLGDASSLLGGTLLVTPLLGADGEVYAVSQGNTAVGGFSAKGASASVTSGVPTSARIPNGAIIEREVGFEMAGMERVNLTLRNPDFTTARRVAQSINAYLRTQAATPWTPEPSGSRFPAATARTWSICSPTSSSCG